MTRKLLFSLKRDAFEWGYFRAGGKGGQHANKTSSGARCSHRPSGAVGESREQRSQLQNKKTAFRRCVESKKFQVWVRIKALDLPPLDDLVEAMMAPANLKVEVLVNGKWQVVE